MDDIKNRLPPWLTPQFMLSACNFMLIAFTAGTIYSAFRNDVDLNKQAIKELKVDVRELQRRDTSIELLKADTVYIKESIKRIEERLDRPGLSRP